jgi:hypothetical protein
MPVSDTFEEFSTGLTGPISGGFDITRDVKNRRTRLASRQMDRRNMPCTVPDA